MIDQSLRTDVEQLITWLAPSWPIDQLPTVEWLFIFGHLFTHVPEHAAKIYHAGKAQRILVSGHDNGVLPTRFRSEAAYYTHLMVEAGIPKERIVLEEDASNTLENVRLGLKLIKAQTPDLKEILITSVPWSLRRAQATMQQDAPDLTIYPTSFTADDEMLHNPSRIARLIGEVHRLAEYSEKGDIARVSVPAEIKAIVARREPEFGSR